MYYSYFLFCPFEKILINVSRRNYLHYIEHIHIGHNNLRTNNQVLCSEWYEMNVMSIKSYVSQAEVPIF